MKRLYKVEGCSYYDSRFICIILADEMPPQHYGIGGMFVSRSETDEYMEWKKLVQDVIEDYEYEHHCKVNHIYDYTIHELNIDFGRIQFEAVGCNENDYLPIVVSFDKWYIDY